MDEVAGMLRRLIRDVPDFPKPGVMFKDITPLLKDPEAFRQCIDALAERYEKQAIDAVTAVEARGFIVGTVLAYRLGRGMIPIRKAGKLPWKTEKVEYSLEYGTDTVEIHQDAVAPGARILVADDLLATGGTALATAQLIEKLGGRVVEIAFLIELSSLKGREKLKGYPVFSLVTF